MRPRKRVLYVEGGGDRNPSLASECRRAFSKLFEKAGIERRPTVVVCGGRKHAYDRFCAAHQAAEDDVWLLVDAEALVAPTAPFDPWAHVKARVGDGWRQPNNATDDQLQLMNVVMETWLLSDRDALKKVFGPKLDVNKLPAQGPTLERKDKAAIYASLEAATKPTGAGKYGKGAHAFKVLAELSPDSLCTLAWGKRFLDAMKT